MQVKLYPKHNKINPSFKGWDASRPLRYVVMTEPGHKGAISKSLSDIGKTCGFDVLLLSDRKLTRIEDVGFSNAFTTEALSAVKKLKDMFVRTIGVSQWAQDEITLTPNGNAFSCLNIDMFLNEVARKFSCTPNSSGAMPEGGNLFFIKGKKGYELLVGKSDKNMFFNWDTQDLKLRKSIDIEKLKQNFGVRKITFLPEMDYHLDLFIRPLDDKRILLTDDSKTIEVLDNAILKIKQKIKSSNSSYDKEYFQFILQRIFTTKRKFLEEISKNPSSEKINKIEKILKNNNFEIIRVPGRLYSVSDDKFLQHDYNFMNAIVTKNKDGELVYITGASSIDYQVGLTEEMCQKLGFSFQQAFAESISDYVKPKNVHFISGEENEIQEKLTSYKGGLHCLGIEIPDLFSLIQC